MAKPTLTPSVHPTTMLRCLACLAFVTAPHVLNIRLWAVALLMALIAWRALCVLRGWKLPPGWLRLILVILGFGGVLMSYGNFTGQNAGVAMLVVMLGLKLTESRQRRDWEIVVTLSYFLLITHFLFSQSIFMMIYLFVGVLLITTALADLSHRQRAMPLKPAFKSTGKLVAHALPIMVLLFILFPRIPGPLWGLPADSGAARSGLADQMSPGSIGNLILSDAVAFRVRFDGIAPEKNQMYWRAHVFYNFDGRTWKEGGPDGTRRHPVSAEPTNGRERHSYEVTLEPNRQPWLFALDIPLIGPSDAIFSPSHQMWTKEPVKERRLYRATSLLGDTINEPLQRIMRFRSLRLPQVSNPQAKSLGESWGAEGLSTREISLRALRMFREQPFRYTLQPPALGANSVDAFLFDTQAGFCEHYASAYAVLMRAAGVPTRIVTGYQGGEANDLSDYYIVRQSDAHAWAEIWIAGEGWVRVDPTAAVAPNRVELGLSAALSAEDAPFARGSGTSLRYFIEMNWDLVNSAWNRWVLAYGPELQQSFLERFGLIDWYRMTLALTVLIVGFLAFLGVMIIREARPTGTVDQIEKEWLHFCQRLAKKGLPRLPHEGPQDYAARLATTKPELSAAIKPVVESYIRLRYGRDSAEINLSDIKTFRITIKNSPI